MPAYIVSYDLSDKSDYTKLYEELENDSNYSSCKILESVYIVITNLTIKQLRNNLRSTIYKNDPLLIARISLISSRSLIDGTYDEDKIEWWNRHFKSLGDIKNKIPKF